jgi:hypothetical protein
MAAARLPSLTSRKVEAMASETDVINAALVKIGEKRITSQGYATPTNERERVANEHYERLRDGELRKNRWNFSIKWLALSADETEPDNPYYEVRYAVPADCLRVIELYETTDFKVESGYIICNESDGITLRYVRRVTVVNDFDALFYDALAARIAVEFCDRLTGKRSKRQEVVGEYTAFMAQAANTDAIESPLEDFTEDEWITARC